MPPQGVWLEPSRSALLEEIENLLASDDQELTGDFSKVGATRMGWVRGCCPHYSEQGLSLQPHTAARAQSELVALVWERGAVPSQPAAPGVDDKSHHYSCGPSPWHSHVYLPLLLPGVQNWPLWTPGLEGQMPSPGGAPETGMTP